MSDQGDKLFGGIEAGGTKFNCIVGSGPDDVRAQARFETTTPEETISQVVRFFDGWQVEHGPLSGVGLGSFGPVDLDPASATYGHITSTPKPGWCDTDILSAIRQGLGVPVAFDTDVNCAGLGEWQWGRGQGTSVMAYLTVGTGIGGGLLVNGRPVHGLIHPEMGHVPLLRHRDDKAADGVCPAHGNCAEGLASGTAIRARWGRILSQFEPSHPAYNVVADYIAQLCVMLTFLCSPERIIIGGGVMETTGLHGLIAMKTKEKLGGYLQGEVMKGDLTDYIVAPGLGARAGSLGALVLAKTV
ncbi:MAG: ROK family protein [Alphaproteobacteria bacterium]|nr:ROK family protein [Alphaproteobacteria bacterium]